MSYSNPNPNHILGHKLIAPDTISYCNLYKILSGGHFNNGHYFVLQPQVDKIVNDRLQPYIETNEHTKAIVLAQETVIKQQNQMINNMTNKINKMAL